MASTSVPVRPSPPRTSVGAEWHFERRRAIIAAHPSVKDLMGPDRRTLPLLFGANVLQLLCAAVVSPRLSWPLLTTLALSVGGTLSLCQFAVLHDVIHGGVVTRGSSKSKLLWFGSLPSVFGYFLYLQAGHLSHHAHMGTASLADTFESAKNGFEDGDVLFVAHRQNTRGATFPLSLSAAVFGKLWRPGKWRLNLGLYSASMLVERLLLAVNDKVVAVTGFNAFFPNKPPSFHRTGRDYARLTSAVQLLVWFLGGWKALGYLWIAEVGWQLPTHPACAMFVSNHESRTVTTTATTNARTNSNDEDSGNDRGGSSSSSSSSSSSGRNSRNSKDGGVGRTRDEKDAGTQRSDLSSEVLTTSCQPSTSVYLGKWFDVACVHSNYHVEHHDFPEVFESQTVNLEPCYGLKKKASKYSPIYHYHPRRRPDYDVFILLFYNLCCTCVDATTKKQVPFLRLPELRRRALDFYTPSTSTTAVATMAKTVTPGPYGAATAWWPTLRHAFSFEASGDGEGGRRGGGFYACTGIGSVVAPATVLTTEPAAVVT